MNINLSIIIVTYNCESFIERFLNELQLSLVEFLDYELLIADNNSTDNTIKIINSIQGSDTQLTVLNSNLGFSKANNLLIKESKYENILLLNPDVFGFTANLWSKLFSLWDKKDPLFIRLLNEDLSFQDCVGDIAGPHRILKRLLKPVDFSIMKEPVEVGMGIMAFMLTTRAIFNEVGLLSEDYHMYSEDMDWCYRAKLKGYKIIFDPRIELIHIGGASAKTSATSKKTAFIKYNSQKKFIKMHYKGLKLILSIFAANIMILKNWLSK